MQRIVVSWERSGFDWAFSGQYCIEYESIEKFYCDLESALKNARNEAIAANRAWKIFMPADIVVAGVEFECEHLGYIDENGELVMDAEIKLLDDWFVDNYNSGLIQGAKNNDA